MTKLSTATVTKPSMASISASQKFAFGTDTAKHLSRDCECNGYRCFRRVGRSSHLPNPLAPRAPVSYTCTFMADFDHTTPAGEAAGPAEVARNARYGLNFF